MNKNLKPAIRAALTIILGGLLLGILLLKEELKELGIKTFILIFIFGNLIPAVIAAVGVYYNKKYIIEDERLIHMRQKAESIWFNAIIGGIIFIPELVIIYANYIHNPRIIFGTSTIFLDELAWIVTVLACGMVFVALVGTAITYKVLMKGSEK